MALSVLIHGLIGHLIFLGESKKINDIFIQPYNSYKNNFALDSPQQANIFKIFVTTFGRLAIFMVNLSRDVLFSNRSGLLRFYFLCSQQPAASSSQPASQPAQITAVCQPRRLFELTALLFNCFRGSKVVFWSIFYDSLSNGRCPKLRTYILIRKLLLVDWNAHLFKNQNVFMSVISRAVKMSMTF